MADLRPALPVAVDIDTKRFLIDTRTGERVQSVEHVYTEYDVGRIRAGYCCIHCGEAQHENGLPVAFPEKCWVCAFPMRQEQTRRFASEFDGATHIGSAKSIAELRTEDEEAKERARRKLEGNPTSRILVPAWVSR